jgi:transposase
MDYAKLIKETVEALLEVEQQQKQALLRDRVRFIRILKAGEVKSQRLAGEQIGLKERQSQRLWHTYRTKGIEGLLAYPYKGTFGKLSTTQVSRLRSYLKTDSVDTLKQAQTFLQKAFGVDYTLAGISLLFKRLKIKLKTGRPTNIRQDQAEKQAFKKTSLR